MRPAGPSLTSLKRSLRVWCSAALCASLILAAGSAVALFAWLSSPEKPKKIELLRSATSPNGTWVAESYFEIYSNDNDVRLALHHPQKTPVTYEQFLPPMEYSYYKWLDDSTLLIATPEGSKLDTTLHEFNGVHLQYAYYPEDPDTPQIVGSQKIFTKKAAFTSRLEVQHNVGLPGVACNLNMTAPDGEYINNVSLRISAARQYLHGNLEHAPENVYSVLIPINGDAEKSLGHRTGVKLQGFSPKHEYFKRGATLVKAPLGNFALNGQEEFLSLMHKLKSGDLHVKVGFWLDNAEVIYTNAVPKNLSAIKAFEQCIDQNHIFTSFKTEK